MSKIDKTQVDSTILTEDDPAGASALNDLTDVTISAGSPRIDTSPRIGDTLVYQGSPQLWVPGATIISVVKSIDEDVVSSTTLQDDDELVVFLTRTGIWQLDWNIIVRDIPVGAGYKQDFSTVGIGSLPAWYIYQANTNSSNTDLDQVGIDNLTEDVVIPVASGSGSTNIYMRMVVNVATLSTPPQVQLRWAQNVSNATATRMEADSSVVARWVGDS